MVARDYQLTLISKRAGLNIKNMYLGEIHQLPDGKVMVYLPSAPTQQKWYELSKFNNVNILDKISSKIVEVDLIPNQSELDEQPEYTARIVKPLINFYDN